MSIERIDLNEYQNTNPHLIAAIKKYLKVGCSNSNAYDIQAIAKGLKNYHVAKSIGSQPYYHLELNLGSSDHPFVVRHDLGHFKTESAALNSLNDKLTNIKYFFEWTLYEDDKPSEHIKSEPNGRGINCQISASVDDKDTLKRVLEHASEMIYSGSRHRLITGEGFSWTYNVGGEPYNSNDLTVGRVSINRYHDYLIIDEYQGGKITYKGDNREEVEAFYTDTLRTNYIDQSGVEVSDKQNLILLEQISILELKELSEHNYAFTVHAIVEDLSIRITCSSYSEVLLQLCDMDKPYYLYLEINKSSY